MSEHIGCVYCCPRECSHDCPSAIDMLAQRVDRAERRAARLAYVAAEYKRRAKADAEHLDMHMRMSYEEGLMVGHEDDRRQGAEQERARIVAALRRLEAAWASAPVESATARHIANKLEIGEL